MSRVRRTLLGLPALLVVLAGVLSDICPGQGVAGPATFSGSRAFEDVKHLVSFGPRPSGSKALDDAREWITQQLKQSGWQVEQDSFLAATPLGEIPMVNIVAKLPGTRPDVVILAGHYET